jgi:hypothetical protein
MLQPKIIVEDFFICRFHGRDYENYGLLSYNDV